MFKSLNKGIATLLIIVILLILLAGGVLAYWYWTSLVITQETKTTEDLLKILTAHRSDWASPSPYPGEWAGTITLINTEERIIEARGIRGVNQTTRSAVLPEAIIEDKQGNPLSLNALKVGDFVAITGIYQMAGKMTSQAEVVVVAEKIKVLGECIEEGEERISDIRCCPGLTLLEQKYCTKCGDGVCKSPENQENCPLDCTKISKPIRISIFIDRESFDLDNKTFEGRAQVEKTNVKVLISDSTKFYRMADDQKEYLTFSEFYSMFKRGINWPFIVKGVREKEDVIRADEVFWIVQ